MTNIFWLKGPEEVTNPMAITQETRQPTSVWYVSRLPLNWGRCMDMDAKQNPQNSLTGFLDVSRKLFRNGLMAGRKDSNTDGGRSPGCLTVSMNAMNASGLKKRRKKKPNYNP